MTETLIELTEDEFDQQFPLVPNHLNHSASWVLGTENAKGCLFETYGDELEFIKRQDRGRIWTLMDGDDGDMYVVSGFHFVNRVGYLSSRLPVPGNALIQVHIPMQINDSKE